MKKTRLHVTSDLCFISKGVQQILREGLRRRFFWYPRSLRNAYWLALEMATQYTAKRPSAENFHEYILNESLEKKEWFFRLLVAVSKYHIRERQNGTSENIDHEVSSEIPYGLEPIWAMGPDGKEEFVGFTEPDSDYRPTIRSLKNDANRKRYGRIRKRQKEAWDYWLKKDPEFWAIGEFRSHSDFE